MTGWAYDKNHKRYSTKNLFCHRCLKKEEMYGERGTVIIGSKGDNEGKSLPFAGEPICYPCWCAIVYLAGYYTGEHKNPRTGLWCGADWEDKLAENWGKSKDMIQKEQSERFYKEQEESK